MKVSGKVREEGEGIVVRIVQVSGDMELGLRANTCPRQ